MNDLPKRELSAEEALLFEEIVNNDFLCTHLLEDDWGRALVDYFQGKCQA